MKLAPKPRKEKIYSVIYKMRMSREKNGDAENKKGSSKICKCSRRRLKKRQLWHAFYFI